MKQVNYLKRVQGLLVLLILAFAAPMLTACGSDDDEPEAPHPIVGIWKKVKEEVYDKVSGTYYATSDKVYYERYAQDGTFERSMKPDMADVYQRGTWKMTGSKLTHKYKNVSDGNSYETVSTFTLTGNILVLVAENTYRRRTFERVP